MPYIKRTSKPPKENRLISQYYPNELAAFIAKRVFENMLNEKHISYRRR